MRILVTGGSGFIGTNLVHSLRAAGHTVLDASLEQPLDPANRPYWKKMDILDPAGVRAVFAEFSPEAVVHLAARADCDEATTVEAGYRANTDGTASVLDAIGATPSVQRAVITSSQFVCGPGYSPKDDEDFHPATIYGQSKVITEQLTRRADLDACWTIIRPTNIWGPWHLRYQREFWRILQKGLYVHPGGTPVVRCYGYVGNVAWQILQILERPRAVVDRQVFYVGDLPGDIYGWVNAFSRALRGKDAVRVPRLLLQTLGLAGDAISAVKGKPFYITSSRYRSMTSNYEVPGAMEKTFAILGPPPFTVEQGVEQTANWLRSA